MESVEDFGSKSVILDESEGNSERSTGDTYKRYIRLYKLDSTVRKYKYF